MDSDEAQAVLDRGLREVKRLRSKLPPYHTKQHEWDAAVHDILVGTKWLHDAAKMLTEINDDVVTGKPSRSRQRWSDWEDDGIVNATADGISVSEIALMIHRTPAAVATRISYLVGIKRLFVNVDGRIVGSLEGDDVDGHFTGVLHKEKANA